MAPRGSDYLRKRFSIDEAQLKRVAAIADGDRTKIIDWWIYGQPGIDRLSATLSAPRGDIGRVVEELLVAAPRGTIELFPYGIPFPEEFLIKFKSGPQ